MATYSNDLRDKRQDEHDIQGTAEQVSMNSQETFSYGLQHMDTPSVVRQAKNYVNQL